MVKNKAVSLLAVISTVLCGAYIVLSALTVIFQKEIYKLLLNGGDAVYNIKVLPAGAIVRIVCAAAFTVLNVRLLKSCVSKPELYCSYAFSAVILIGGAAADIIHSAGMRKTPESLAAYTAVKNLSVWFQPLLLAGAVMTILACFLDIHIRIRRPLGSKMIKLGLGISASYAVILLLIITLQKSYTGSKAFVFPLGSILELISAMFILISGILMLFGTDMNASLPLMVSVSAFISCCFLEAPLNAGYSYFLGHFLEAEDIAALGTVLAYAGYASYIYFAGAAVTMICAAAFIIDGKNRKDG